MNYMSPEQASGSTSDIDQTTDIFALGTLSYRLLTGRLPFVGRDMSEVLDKIVHHAPDLSLLPPATRLVLAKALSKAKSGRYQQVGSFATRGGRVAQAAKVSPAKLPSSCPACNPRSSTAAIALPCSTADAVPPLRQRREDIGPLVEHFIRRTNGSEGRTVSGVDPQAARLLHAYLWPGNVRELKNAIERAVVVAADDQIAVKDLPQAIWRAEVEHPPRASALVASAAADEGDIPPRQLESLDLREYLERAETELIVEALRRAEGNRRQAAKLVNIPLRTLGNRLTKLRIKKSYAPNDGS